MDFFTHRGETWDSFRKAGGQLSRLRLSDDEWDSIVLVLACEGLSINQMEGVLVSGREPNLREKWEIGDQAWKDGRKRALTTIYSFLKLDILRMYVDERCSPGQIAREVKDKTGFRLPESTLLKQLNNWNVAIRGKNGGSSKAKKPPQQKPDAKMSQAGPARGTSVLPDPLTPPAAPSSPHPQTPVSDTPSGNNGYASPSPSPSPLFVGPSMETFPSPVLEETGDMCTLERWQARNEQWPAKEEQLRSLMEQLQAQEKSLQAQRIQSASDAHNVTAENQSLQARIADLLKQGQSLQARLDQRDPEINGLRTTMAQMTFRHNQICTDYKALDAQCKDVCTQYEALRAEYNASQLENAELRTLESTVTTGIIGLLESPNTQFSKQDIITWWNNLGIRSTRRCPRNSAYFTGSGPNMNSPNFPPNKRRRLPQDQFHTPDLARSISYGGPYNPGLSYSGVGRQAYTEPQSAFTAQSLDESSIMGRQDEYMTPATSYDLQTMSMDMPSQDTVVMGMSGNDSWASDDQTRMPEHFFGEILQQPLFGEIPPNEGTVDRENVASTIETLREWEDVLQTLPAGQ